MSLNAFLIVAVSVSSMLIVGVQSNQFDAGVSRREVPIHAPLPPLRPSILDHQCPPSAEYSPGEPSVRVLSVSSPPTGKSHAGDSNPQPPMPQVRVSCCLLLDRSCGGAQDGYRRMVLLRKAPVGALK